MSQQVNALDITPDKLRVAAAGKLQIVLLSPELCFLSNFSQFFHHQVINIFVCMTSTLAIPTQL